MPLSDQINVFIPSGAGAPGFAGIVNCLRIDSRVRIFSGDVNPSAYGRALSDQFFEMPLSSQLDYVKTVIEISIRHRIHVILPITTAELEPLSHHKEEIEALGISVVISDAISLNTANNKGKLYEFLRNHESQIPIPDFGFAANKEDFQRVAEQLLNSHQEICFKPVTGNGSRGFGIIAKNVTGNFLLNKASILPMKLNEWLLRMPEIFQTPLLISKYLTGKEYSVDLLCSEGKVLLCIPRTRDKMIGGISVAGTIENNFTLKAFCISLVNALQLSGPIGIQWREDEQGMPRLLEINPRLQGTTSACLLAGVNIPLLSILQVLGEDLKIENQSVKWGTKFTRYWADAKVE